MIRMWNASKIQYGIFVSVIFGYCFQQAIGQCTFGNTFNGTTWHDSTRGDVTFTETTMSKWTHSPATVLEFPSWTCMNFTADTIMVLRTTSTVRLSSGDIAYAYVCMKLTAITDFSFSYYLQNLQQPELAYERVTISALSTLTQTDVCDETITVPTMEYHVLVKSGFENDAAIQCPDSLLFSADYVYYGSDGTTACDTSSDVWDVCTNRSLMTFDYNTCSQQIAFSASGVLWCVAHVRATYDYTLVYNNDTAVDGSTTERFSCIVSESTLTYVSIAPRNCSIDQSPTTFAKDLTQNTNKGHRLVLGTKYQICRIEEDDTGLSTGAIVAIVLSVLYLIYMWTITTIVISIIMIWILLQFFVVLLELTGKFDPGRNSSLSYIDIPEPNVEFGSPSKDSVVSPSVVDIKKSDKLVKHDALDPILENGKEPTVNDKIPDSNGHILKKEKTIFISETEMEDFKRKSVLPAIHRTNKDKKPNTPRWLKL